MLNSYEALLDCGEIRWLDRPPTCKSARVIVTVLPEVAPDELQKRMGRQPPAMLKGSMHIEGDLLVALASESEWAAQMERTARQLSGDPEAFR
ncbi:MAG: hypothetical protein H7834_07105 [Magnetococcus sp. YQC-9]